MHDDGILGSRRLGQSRARVSVDRKWLQRREIWLVILGVILHAVYMLSIFDIYFKTPIVHGMDLVTPRFKAPAKRLVLLICMSPILCTLSICWNFSQRCFFCCCCSSIEALVLYLVVRHVEWGVNLRKNRVALCWGCWVTVVSSSFSNVCLICTASWWFYVCNWDLLEFLLMPGVDQWKGEQWGFLICYYLLAYIWELYLELKSFDI